MTTDEKWINTLDRIGFKRLSEVVAKMYEFYLVNPEKFTDADILKRAYDICITGNASGYQLDLLSRAIYRNHNVYIWGYRNAGKDIHAESFEADIENFLEYIGGCGKP